MSIMDSLFSVSGIPVFENKNLKGDETRNVRKEWVERYVESGGVRHRFNFDLRHRGSKYVQEVIPAQYYIVQGLGIVAHPDAIVRLNEAIS